MERDIDMTGTGDEKCQVTQNLNEIMSNLDEIKIKTQGLSIRSKAIWNDQGETLHICRSQTISK